MNAEVIIVGGGIIGCAAAYNLAKNGVSVLVLEGSENIGNGGSTRNGGGFFFRFRTESPKFPSFRPSAKYSPWAYAAVFPLPRPAATGNRRRSSS